MYILMYLGGNCILLLLPPMIYRRYAYSRIRPQLLEFLDEELANEKWYKDRRSGVGTENDRPLAKAVVEAIKQSELLHRALGMTIVAVMFHNFFCLFIGTFIMYGISLLYDDPPETQARGFSKLWTHAFLTASSFFNCGFTLTSDSMFQYTTKYGIYIWSSFLILAGNTAAPMCIRGIVRIMHIFAVPLGLDKGGLRYALDNPRLVTTHIFRSRQNLALLIILVFIDVTEFIFFLASDLNRPEMQVSHSHMSLPLISLPTSARGCLYCHKMRAYHFEIANLGT